MDAPGTNTEITAPAACGAVTLDNTPGDRAGGLRRLDGADRHLRAR
jgi:hypothetical protein